MSTLNQQITELAAQALAAHGLVLVQAVLTGGTTGGRGKLTLNVMAERPDFTSPTLEECTQVSRTLSAQLDVADIIKSPYTLEVGSPGLERPLLSAADYRRFAGRQAKITFAKPVENPAGKGVLGTATGIIAASDDVSVTLALEGGHRLTSAYKAIRHAQLSPSAAEFQQLMKKEVPHGA